MANTHMDGEHPNRIVAFLDNSFPIPFLHDPNHPELSYHLGFSLGRTMRERIADFEPSLIHITVPDCTCLHLIQYAREKEIPLMGTFHSNIPEYMSHYPGIGWLKHVLAALFRHQYNFLQALYVPTPFIHKHLTNTAKMDKVTNLGVWGRGIDLERFSPKHRSRKFRQEMGFDDTDVVICWVGRLVPEKRPDIFFNVVRRLHERNIPFRALVVGAGPMEQEVKDLPNTTFAGWMSGEELAVAYASCDIFLFPSAVETFGNVTLEAAASGLPLVVEAGCSGHLVRHGVNGFACHADDVDAFFDSTLCLVLDDMRRKSMSEEGRKFSMQFEQRTICKKMLENYSKVTDEFYFEYGGHHANRDQIYQKEHSFVGGNVPRPLGLVFVELLFILFFRVMYQMFTLWLYIREMLVFAPTGFVEEVDDPATLIPESSTSRLSFSSGTDTVLSRIKEVEECSDSDTETQDVDMQEFAVDHLMKADDDTDSTTSLSVDSSSCRRQESCCRPLQMDFQISHVLAIGFVNLMQFLFRLESRLRNGFNHCCTPTKWNLIKRKRKNSNFAFEVPDVQKQRSDGSDVSDDLEILVNPARDERLSMRRPNLSLVEL
jgi:glycosyltransferase involved in cell wall biosynthesis